MRPVRSAGSIHYLQCDPIYRGALARRMFRGGARGHCRVFASGLGTRAAFSDRRTPPGVAFEGKTMLRLHIAALMAATLAIPACQKSAEDSASEAAKEQKKA